MSTPPWRRHAGQPSPAGTSLADAGVLVHTLDGQHKITSGAAQAVGAGAGASEEDTTLRMSFAANSERNLVGR